MTYDRATAHRYTKEQSIGINRCIHDANIANFSTEETMRYIEDKVGVKIKRTSICERRRLLRKESIKIWNNYRKNDYQLRIDYLDRMRECKRVIESAGRKMLETENDSNKFFQWKGACAVILEANKQLAEYESLIKEIDAIGHEIQEELYTIPRTTQDPEAVF